MHMKKLFGILLLSVITFAGFFGFFSGNGPGDKTTMVDFLNNGGQFTVTNNGNVMDVPAAWSAGTNMPAPTRYHGGGCMWKNAAATSLKLICFGGDPDGTGATPSNLVNVYDVVANTWSLGVNTPTGRFYTSAVCVGDTAYCVAGMTSGAFTSVVATVDRYNVVSNTMSAGTPLPVALGDGKAVAYQDSLFYYIGGFNSTSTGVATVYLYSQLTGTFRTATPITVPSESFGCAITGDTIVVTCGGTGYNVGLRNTVYKGLISTSDHSTITWTTGANYPGTGLHRQTAGAWGCRGIIVGPSSPTGFGTNTECYVYSPGANTWTLQPNATTPTSCYFGGSSKLGTNGIWKFVVASGLVLSPPYSIPQVQVFTDSLCGAAPPAALCEQFTSATFPPTGWTYVPGGTAYWIRNAVSGFGLGSGSAQWDCWNGPNATRQTMTTLQCAPSGPGAVIFVDVAYQPFGTAPDSIIIASSTDNGTTYVSTARLARRSLQQQQAVRHHLYLQHHSGRNYHSLFRQEQTR